MKHPDSGRLGLKALQRLTGEWCVDEDDWKDEVCPGVGADPARGLNEEQFRSYAKKEHDEEDVNEWYAEATKEKILVEARLRAKPDRGVELAEKARALLTGILGFLAEETSFEFDASRGLRVEQSSEDEDLVFLASPEFPRLPDEARKAFASFSSLLAEVSLVLEFGRSVEHAVQEATAAPPTKEEMISQVLEAMSPLDPVPKKATYPLIAELNHYPDDSWVDDTDFNEFCQKLGYKPTRALATKGVPKEKLREFLSKLAFGDSFRDEEAELEPGELEQLWERLTGGAPALLAALIAGGARATLELKAKRSAKAEAVAFLSEVEAPLPIRSILRGLGGAEVVQRVQMESAADLRRAMAEMGMNTPNRGGLRLQKLRGGMFPDGPLSDDLPPFLHGAYADLCGLAAELQGFEEILVRGLPGGVQLRVGLDRVNPTAIPLYLGEPLLAGGEKRG